MTVPASSAARRRPRGATTATLIVLGMVACENPQPPVACGSAPQVTMNAGEQGTVTACFNDPNGDMLIYTAASSNPGVATVSISGTAVTVTAVAPGNAFVSITAADPGGLQGQQSFQVMVPNRPPKPRGTIASITVHVGRTESVDVSPYFAEPDGEVLAYGATSSNPAVATVSMAGSMVSVTAVTKGTTTLSVTATDPGGLAATQTFWSTVPNRSPEPVGTIPGQTVEVGDPITVDLSPYFSDPDGDPLNYTARSSSSRVARVSVSGSTVTITAVAKGTANVAITATDSEGLSATQTFESMVPNRSPEPVGAIPDETVEVGEDVTVDLSRYFKDLDGDVLTYTARSSNTSVARVSVSGSTVTIRAVAKGTAEVTITATDSEGLSATQVFESMVPNRPPEPTRTIPDETVEVGDDVTVNLSRYFEDPDGDALTYTARSSNTSVATVSVSGSIVTITAEAKGTAEVTATATDSEGLSATQTFETVVPNRAPEPVGTIADETVEVGDEVIVDLSSYFEDPDGDALTYTATSSSTSVASVSVSGSIVTITARATGRATITATARDPDGLTATQRARVTVEQSNRAPRPVGTIPGQTLNPGGTRSIDASRYFTDPDGDALTYTATSSGTSVARVSVSGSTVTITAAATGTATITITATDPDDLTATQRATVTVERPNRAPRPVGTIPARTLNPGGTRSIDASRYFTDPDGDALTYTAASSNPSVATVAVSGSAVTITAVASGSATVTITARDPGGLTTNQTFRMTVEDRGSFDIDLVFATEVTSAQERAFRDAAERWMAILADSELPDYQTGGTIDCGGQYEQSVATIDDLMIVAAVEEIDGPGGILGQAGPCWVRVENRLPLFGRMVFDAADLERVEREGRLRPLILHEMGHVLGIGTLWGYHGLLRNPSSETETLDTHFAGSLAVAAFNEAGGDGYTGGAKVPVENTGGPGTRNAHWRVSVFGNELMIGWLGNSPPLSAITIQSLADLGYTVDPGLDEAYRLPDAATAAAIRDDAIDLGNDILRDPIVVVDPNGRIVRVIPP